MNKYQQQPSEVVDYVVDLTVWVPENDTVVNTEVSVTHMYHSNPNEPVTLVVRATDIATKKPKIWCVGGTDGVEYKVTVLITTNSGRVKEVDFRVKVQAQ